MDLSKEMQDKIIVKIKELESEKERYKHNGTLMGVLNRDIELLNRVFNEVLDISKEHKEELRERRNLLHGEIIDVEKELDILKAEQGEIRLVGQILEDKKSNLIQNEY